MVPTVHYPEYDTLVLSGHLKVVYNEKEGGLRSEKVANVRDESWTVAIEDCLSSCGYLYFIFVCAK